MASELLIAPTTSTTNSWTWIWEDDYQDVTLQGKITSNCELTITRKDGSFTFKYTFGNCVNNNTLKKLKFDIVISSSDSNSSQAGLAVWSREGVPITLEPSKSSGKVTGTGTIPKQYFKNGKIGNAGRKIY
jgi:hypothetical protein